MQGSSAPPRPLGFQAADVSREAREEHPIAIGAEVVAVIEKWSSTVEGVAGSPRAQQGEGIPDQHTPNNPGQRPQPRKDGTSERSSPLPRHVGAAAQIGFIRLNESAQRTAGCGRRVSAPRRRQSPRSSAARATSAASAMMSGRRSSEGPGGATATTVESHWSCRRGTRRLGRKSTSPARRSCTRADVMRPWALQQVPLSAAKADVRAK